MTKVRILVFLVTIIVISVFGTMMFLYAKGYRFDTKRTKIMVSGLLILKSDPEGAQILINGEPKGVTNTNLSLEPNTYDVTIEKEGYLPWNKRLNVEKEIVTQATAHLFKTVPSLTALTFTNANSPIISPDFSKILYIVSPSASKNTDKSGVWVMEMINLPIGFSREPRRITDADFSNSTLIWSPDSREILALRGNYAFLLNAQQFTPQNQLLNVTLRKDEILNDWKKQKQKRLESQESKLPDALKEILKRKASSVVFSPDEDMVLYTASGSAELKPGLIKPLPGASTQKEERTIKPGKTYVYDIKEDRNFLITEDEVSLWGWIDYNQVANQPIVKRSLVWFPTSRHLILAEESKITIMDYDSTNRQTVYSGSYISPYAFPTLSLDRLIILTNLGANESPPNLYSLEIK